MSETNIVRPSPKEDCTVPKAIIRHADGTAFIEGFHHIDRDGPISGDAIHVWYEEDAPGRKKAPRCDLYREEYYMASIESVVFEPPGLECEIIEEEF